MTAHDNLSPAQFYHGTSAELKPGDTVDPSFAGRNEGDRVPKGTAFFTSDRHAARFYGRASHGGSVSRVYTVEPTGHYETDPDNETFLGDNNPLRTKSPLRVTGTADEQERNTDYQVPFHAPGRDPFDVWIGKTLTHPEGNRDKYGNLTGSARVPSP